MLLKVLKLISLLKYVIFNGHFDSVFVNTKFHDVILVMELLLEHKSLDDYQMTFV